VDVNKGCNLKHLTATTSVLTSGTRCEQKTVTDITLPQRPTQSVG